MQRSTPDTPAQTKEHSEVRLSVSAANGEDHALDASAIDKWVARALLVRESYALHQVRHACPAFRQLLMVSQLVPTKRPRQVHV